MTAASILMIVYLAAVPLVVLRMAERWPWIDKVSPMTVLYVIGLIVGNSGLLSQDLPGQVKAVEINTLLGNLAIPIAIPLMLMGCNLRKWSTGKAIKAFLSGLVAVLGATVSGYFLFRDTAVQHLTHKDYAQVCAVATGIYTGGIPNMGAIKQGVGMGRELYLCITSYDLIVTGIYLIFIIFFGKTVFRHLLPADKRAKKKSSSQHSKEKLKEKEAEQYTDTKKIHPFDKAHRKSSLFTLGLTLIIAAISYAVSSLCFGGKVNMTVLILTLTTLSIAASFLPAVQRQEHSFDIGFYFVCVFCLSIATSCDVRRIDLLGNLSILWYIFFVVFGSVILQILFAKLLKLDGDSVMVTSVALINSPPFVPMVAGLLKNKEVVILGIFVGLLGYVFGNYLGIGIYHLLMLIGG